MNHKNLRSLVKPSKHPFPANPYVLILVLLVSVFLSCKGIASLRREYWPSSYEIYLEWWSIGSYALVVIFGLTAILFEVFFFISYWKLRKIFQGSGIGATASNQASVVMPGIELIDKPANHQL